MSLSFLLFVSLCAVAGAVSVICVCWGCDVYYNVESRSKRDGVFGVLGFRGFVIGLFYGLHYVYQQRWVLRFPIIQVIGVLVFLRSVAFSDRFLLMGCCLTW